MQQTQRGIGQRQALAAALARRVLHLGLDPDAVVETEVPPLGGCHFLAPRQGQQQETHGDRPIVEISRNIGSRNRVWGRILKQRIDRGNFLDAQDPFALSRDRRIVGGRIVDAPEIRDGKAAQAASADLAELPTTMGGPIQDRRQIGNRARHLPIRRVFALRGRTGV